MAEERGSLTPLGQDIKRALDVVVSTLVLAVTVPIAAIVAVCIRVSMGRPVLFRQVRPGRGEEPFTMLKFRTMTTAEDPVLTPFGRLLRSTSLDELPQLVNVLRGEMSLVGPRPLLMRYLPWFSEEERRRFLVRPGIAGWAQVHGRNELPWDERLALDVWYVDHWSLRLDALIIAKALAAVLRRQGYAERPELLMRDLDEERRARIPGDTTP